MEGRKGKGEDWEGRKETLGREGGRGWDGNLVFLAGLGTPGDPGIQGRLGGSEWGGVGLGKGWNPTRASEIVCPASLLYNMGKLRLKPARMALLEPKMLSRPWRPGWLRHPSASQGSLNSFSSQLWPVQAGISHALQTQAAASLRGQAGMGPSATSPALLAPLGRTAGSSAPTAGLERPVSQTLGTVSTVSLAGGGPR